MRAQAAQDGITGATMERPGLQSVLQLVASGRVQTLIIEDVERLSRDAEHLMHMVKLFRLHQVTVHTVVAGKIDDLVLSFKQAEARSARDVKFRLPGNPLSDAERPAHLLSGLVTCGTCDSPFLATGARRWRCKGAPHGDMK